MTIEESKEKYGEELTEKIISLSVIGGRSRLFVKNELYEECVNAKIITRRTKNIVINVRIAERRSYNYNGKNETGCVKVYCVAISSIKNQSRHAYTLHFDSTELT